MSTTDSPGGTPRRDLLQAYPVIDGPDQGEQRAWAKDSYISLAVWDARRVSEQPPSAVYRLRRHAELGLVWASEDGPALSDPYAD